MTYLYGEFSGKQIKINATIMHNEIHKLLLYKDPEIENKLFKSNDDFLTYFKNLLSRYGGLNELFGEPKYMIAFMATMQAAYDMVNEKDYDFKAFRRLILDAHGYIKLMFESEV